MANEYGRYPRFTQGEIIRMGKHGDLPPGTMRVLFAVLAQSEVGICTLKSLALLLGLRSTNAIWVPLHRLRMAGLISWRWKQPSVKQGTIRPTCRFIPADQLEGMS